MHSKKTAFIVEHDFIMAAYLADRWAVPPCGTVSYCNFPQCTAEAKEPPLCLLLVLAGSLHSHLGWNSTHLPGRGWLASALHLYLHMHLHLHMRLSSLFLRPPPPPQGDCVRGAAVQGSHRLRAADAAHRCDLRGSPCLCVCLCAAQTVRCVSRSVNPQRTSPQ
jgi:hypothetical protein